MADDNLRMLLGKQRKAELIEWIIEQAAGNEDLRRALVGFVAPQADAATLVSELRQIISMAWGRTRTSREPWKLAQPIASDLEPVLSGLDQLIERGHAEAAEEVLRQFVEAAEEGFDQVDDSDGYLGTLCHEAVTLWGKAWARISRRDPLKLAELVFEGVRDNGYGIRDHMIRDFAAALGRDGLMSLKERFLAEHRANAAAQGMDDWKRREPLRHLADVADALGDVDMYIDVQRQSGMADACAMPIARRLLDAGRPAEALEHLDRADRSRPYFQGETDDYTTLRVKILQSLGREGEARDTLWEEFRRGLNATALDRLLALTPIEKRQALVDEAIAVGEAHPEKLHGALFLVERGQLGRAAKLVDAYPGNFQGRYYGMLVKLAELLQQEFPASAWVLYRALLLDILEQKRSKAYHHAADYLSVMDGLASRAGLRDRQQELLELLRQKHGRKYGFWSLVKK